MNFNFDNIPAQPVSAAGEPALVAALVELLHAAPRALTLKEVLTVLEDSGIEKPADTTVRSYLNRAAADGRISKPTRQSYAGVQPTDPVDEADALDDPLADL
jgi:hypothetical protein